MDYFVINPWNRVYLFSMPIFWHSMYQSKLWLAVWIWQLWVAQLNIYQNYLILILDIYQLRYWLYLGHSSRGNCSVRQCFWDIGVSQHCCSLRVRYPNTPIPQKPWSANQLPQLIVWSNLCLILVISGHPWWGLVKTDCKKLVKS